MKLEIRCNCLFIINKIKKMKTLICYDCGEIVEQKVHNQIRCAECKKYRDVFWMKKRSVDFKTWVEQSKLRTEQLRVKKEKKDLD